VHGDQTGRDGGTKKVKEARTLVGVKRHASYSFDCHHTKMRPAGPARPTLEMPFQGAWLAGARHHDGTSWHARRA
jgi:hypothetical protein